MSEFEKATVIVLRQPILDTKASFKPAQPLDNSLAAQFGAVVTASYLKWRNFGSCLVELPESNLPDFSQHLTNEGWEIIPYPHPQVA